MKASKIDPLWMELTTNSLFQLRVERALFESDAQPHFFLHFQATNLTTKRLALDLRDKWLPVHPNQWGAAQSDVRQVIDEGRMTRPPFDDAAKAELLSAYQAGALQAINPGESIDFYVEFNASGRRDVEAQITGAPFLIVSLDGELVATDGSAIERFSLIEDFDPRRSDLVLPTPLTWRPIPSGAIVQFR